MQRPEKLETPVVYTLTRWANHAKEWAALISGPSHQYGVALTFMPVADRRWSRSGKNGETDVLLTHSGYYQISDPGVGKYDREARRYLRVDAHGRVEDGVSEDDAWKQATGRTRAEWKAGKVVIP